MKKEKKTGSVKDFKYNSFVYLKRIAFSVREVYFSIEVEFSIIVVNRR